MFLERFTKLCQEKDVAPARVAADIGLSNSTATKWVKGSIPSGSTLKKIAAYFNVTVDYLIGEETKKESPLPLSGIELSEAKRNMIERILTLSDDQIELLERLADVALDR